MSCGVCWWSRGRLYWWLGLGGGVSRVRAAASSGFVRGGWWIWFIGGGAFLKIVDNDGFAFIVVPSLCTKVKGPMLNIGHIGDRCCFDGGHRSCADNGEQH